jgi:hypothetical protein
MVIMMERREKNNQNISLHLDLCWSQNYHWVFVTKINGKAKVLPDFYEYHSHFNIRK